MINAIDPLAALPGVDLVILATNDGVPIAISGRKAGPVLEAGEDLPIGMDANDAQTAMALSWMGELTQSTSPLGWNPPRRAVMRCARGVLIMERCRGAMLLLFLGRGVSPDGVKLAMDGAIARIERSGRSSAHAQTSTVADLNEAHPPAAIPSQEGNDSASGLNETTYPSPDEGFVGH